MIINGKFEVKLVPLELSCEGQDDVKLGRMSIDKTFYGELDANSKGEMFSALTGVQGSAGYVAIEQVVGNLSGKRGSFILQHFGIMADGSERLVLEVVPDSASGELVGLSGKMKISIEEGQHYYEFEYQLG